jgi:hypothetical protein
LSRSDDGSDVLRATRGVGARAVAVLFAQRGPFTHDEWQRRDAMKKEPLNDLRLLFLRLIAEETPDVATILFN